MALKCLDHCTTWAGRVTHYLFFGTAEASRQILYAGRIYQVLALDDSPWSGHVTRFFKFCPIISFGDGETRRFKCVLTATDVY